METVVHGLFLCFLLASDGSALRQLVEEALKRNPEVLAARKRLEAARQRPAQAASLPEPMVSLGYASIGGPLPGQGLGREPMARAGLMVSQTLPAPGKRDLGRRVALEEAGAAAEEYRAVEQAVRARVKSAWYELGYAYARLGVLKRSRELLERLFELASVRYQTGQGAQKELFEAQAQLTVLETRQAAVELERRRSEARINAMLARPLETEVPSPPSAEPREILVPPEELYRRAQLWSPGIAALRHEVRRNELAIELARKEGVPDLTVAAGYYNMGGMPPMFEVRLDVPLPLFTRTRRHAAVVEQAHSAGAARHRYRAAGNELLLRIYEEWVASSVAWRLLRIYSTTLVPQTALAFEAALAGYESGGSSFAEVLAQLRAVLEAEESYQTALRDYRLSLVRLEELTGAELIEEE